MMVGDNVHYDTYTECDGCQAKRWAIEAEQYTADKLRDQVRELKELVHLLYLSVRHATNCDFMWRDDPCTCGATEARAAYLKAFPNA
jgi:hypothetical protein